MKRSQGSPLVKGEVRGSSSLGSLRDKPSWLALGWLVPALLLGWVLPNWTLFLLTIALAKGLVVVGVVLLMRTGLVSFGQGLFYAGGAYTVGFAMKAWGLKEALLLLPLGMVLSALLAALLGVLVSRYREIFFGMLTMAFSMIAYGLLVKFFSLTGGSDGMGVRAPTFLGFSPPQAALQLIYYNFAVLVLGAAVYGVSRFLASPMGFLGQAIKDNEVRVEYMGASVHRVVYLTYLVAGALGGLGGVLVSFPVGHIVPDFAYWTTSGEFVFVALLGGTGSVFAPVAGSLVMEFLKSYTLRYAPYTWQLLLGTIMLLIILFLPDGLWTLRAVLARRWERWRPS